MPPSVNNIQVATSDESGAGTSREYTLAAGPDRILGLLLGEISSVPGGAIGPTSVLFGGVSFTRAIGFPDTGLDSRLGIWYILGADFPAVETQQIVVTSPNNSDAAFIAFTLSGAAQQAPEAVASRQSGNNPSVLDITTLTDDALVVDLVSRNSGNVVTFTHGAGQTSLVGDGASIGSSPLWMNGSYKALPTAGPTTMVQDQSSGGFRDFLRVAAAFAPSGGGGGPAGNEPVARDLRLGGLRLTPAQIDQDLSNQAVARNLRLGGLRLTPASVDQPNQPVAANLRLGGLRLTRPDLNEENQTASRDRRLGDLRLGGGLW